MNPYWDIQIQALKKYRNLGIQIFTHTFMGEIKKNSILKN